VLALAVPQAAQAAQEAFMMAEASGTDAVGGPGQRDFGSVCVRDLIKGD
jgi:hypothetical protein